MDSRRLLICGTAIAIMMAAAPASADTLRSPVAFNNGIGQKTASQPADGVEVSYQITLQGGDLDGCTVDVVEQLRGRDEGAWGLFDIAGEVTCDDGGFDYTSSGAWDGKGFHAAGNIVEGSGSGRFDGRLRSRGAAERWRRRCRRRHVQHLLRSGLRYSRGLTSRRRWRRWPRRRRHPALFGPALRDRHLADHRAAAQDARLPGGIVRLRLVQHAAVVPDHEVARAPAVGVDQLRPDDRGVQLPRSAACPPRAACPRRTRRGRQGTGTCARSRDECARSGAPPAAWPSSAPRSSGRRRAAACARNPANGSHAGSPAAPSSPRRGRRRRHTCWQTGSRRPRSAPGRHRAGSPGRCGAPTSRPCASAPCPCRDAGRSAAPRRPGWTGSRSRESRRHGTGS